MSFVVQAAVAAGHAADLTTWEGPAIALAVEQTKAFKERMRQPAAQKGAA